MGLCAFMCSSDSNCAGAQKCVNINKVLLFLIKILIWLIQNPKCTNGCGGTNCMDPIAPPVAKAGLCPDTTGIITTCLWGPSNCLNDAACGPNQKCCPYGCSPICMSTYSYF